MEGNVGPVVRRLYLSVYNWAAFFGWAHVLCHATLALLVRKPEAIYTAIEQPLLVTRTAALMEIVHSLVGFVKSPVSATILQLIGRMFVTWDVLWSFPETRPHILVTSLILAWSIAEVIRYPYYGMKETFGFSHFWLLWLRYNMFLILYPIGMLSEVGLIYVTLPYMKASNKYCLQMPNKWNFSFNYHYAYVLLMGIYFPGFPHLFHYMLVRRKVVLSKAKAA
ncbi:hypothetical protein VPH35_106385 [Triticum aestivum]|uniref:very-long-chain (3R)-3-hydroxyacyl-CoA dehydratase PASTICCINO 2B n=1 Tax=Triticum aestivum TaxID=4565 RepID=UPI001949FF54|nr:very-long-chain (3R)-3-hydroxyacyl-CoA dehydratase PASTICCINO 2B-like [Triticum aestivum]